METKISKARLRYLMPVELIKFLKKEKVLCAFINNMTKRLNEVGPEIVRDKLNRLKGIDAIVCAFGWYKTPEAKKDDSFWSNIHNKWVKEFNHE